MVWYVVEALRMYSMVKSRIPGLMRCNFKEYTSCDQRQEAKIENLG